MDYREESWLRRKYWGEGLSIGEIADEESVSPSTIHRWMKKLGVDRHDPPNDLDGPHRDEEWLRERYSAGMSAREMAAEANVGHGTILNWMERHEIDRRTPCAERPPWYGTNPLGYEEIVHEYGRFLVHRLAAVAWFGWESVVDRDVHHKNQCSWDNRESNLELLTRSEHMRRHRTLENAAETTQSQ